MNAFEWTLNVVLVSGVLFLVSAGVYALLGNQDAPKRRPILWALLLLSAGCFAVLVGMMGYLLSVGP